MPTIFDNLADAAIKKAGGEKRTIIFPNNAEGNANATLRVLLIINAQIPTSAAKVADSPPTTIINKDFFNVVSQGLNRYENNLKLGKIDNTAPYEQTK